MKTPHVLSRKEFLKLSAAAAAGLALCGCARVVETPAVENPTAVPTTAAQPATPIPPTAEQAYLAVTHGTDPAEITKRAIAALGGIERFVKSGYDVIIKPNICTNYHPPEYATTTNPVVVATLVSLALGAGAKRVRVMDYPFGGTPDSAYGVSGIADAVTAAGGEMQVMSLTKYATYEIPNAKSMKTCQVFPDILEADVLINVPIAKNHSSAILTLGAKNLMGVVLDRNLMHLNLHQRIADLNSLVRPALTVVDAVRILLDHGPTGGSLEDVKQTNTIIASHDIVCADSYASTLFGLSAVDIPYIKDCADLGLGTMDLSSIKLEEINV